MEELEQLRKNAAAAGGKQKKRNVKDTLKQHEAAKFLRVFWGTNSPTLPGFEASLQLMADVEKSPAEATSGFQNLGTNGIKKLCGT